MTTRRRFLAAAVAAGAGAALPACGEPASPPAPAAPPPPGPPEPAPVAPEPPGPALPDGLRADDFVIHGTSPLNLEMKPDGFGAGPITPTRRVFVRSNLPLPPERVTVEPDRWSVEIAGVVRAQRLRVEELKRLGVRTVVAVLQCSGNGRAYFEHGPSGSPWRNGAAANVAWTGVPLRAVAEACGGVLPDMRFVTSTGGDPLPPDLPERDVVVERSIPIDDGLADALLAWDMNGEPVPRPHGGPLRLVVPGYYGVNQIKHVRRVEFTAAESDAAIQRTRYRVRPVGERGAPGQPTMWRMAPKSWITSPAPGSHVAPGPVRGYGVAFSGGSPIARVEVSVDGGQSFADAEIYGPDLGPFAWRTFTFTFEAPAGPLTLCSRATDDRGRGQPRERVDDDRGYGNTSWHDLRVEITAGERPADPPGDPP